MSKMPKIVVSLRSVFFEMDRSTQPFDPEALEGRLSTERILLRAGGLNIQTIN